MPRRTILLDVELDGLLALPDTEPELICRYTFSDADLAIISQHRGPANCLGFAMQPSAIRREQRRPFTFPFRASAGSIRTRPPADVPGAYAVSCR